MGDLVRERGLGPGSCDASAAFALRPQTHCGSSHVHTGGHPLNESNVRSLQSSLPSRSRVRAASHCSSQSGSSCSGPERFFYDKSTYTGCQRSTASSDASTEADFVDTLRPGHHHTSTYVHINGHALDDSRLKHVDSIAVASPGRERRRSASVCGSNCSVKGPERFFYDKNSYTGVHRNGGPSTID